MKSECRILIWKISHLQLASLTITSFEFNKITVDPCICQKINGSKFTFLVLYVDDIALVSNDLDILSEMKDFFSRNFEMNYMGKTSYVIRIEIFHKIDRKIIETVLK